MSAGLSILIPVFNRDVTELVISLVQQNFYWPGPLEIRVLDDCSTNDCRTVNQLLAGQAGVFYEELPTNVGRAAIRNRLVNSALYNWLLLLDNDSLLPDGQFIARYAQALRTQPAARLFIGGTAYEATPPADPALHLRWHYGRTREMRLATERQRDSTGQLTINNALVEKEVLLRFPLDERLSGYGHEDTRFGLELARAGVEVHHIDNPVLHDGLEPAEVFLGKSRQAVRNLAQVLRTDELGADTRLVRAATYLRRAGLVGVARSALAALAPALRRNLLSVHPSLRALDMLKLSWLLADWR
jgi:glycosyltransferase involved in cell wall biosynthesis